MSELMVAVYIIFGSVGGGICAGIALLADCGPGLSLLAYLIGGTFVTFQVALIVNFSREITGEEQGNSGIDRPQRKNKGSNARCALPPRGRAK